MGDISNGIILKGNGKKSGIHFGEGFNRGNMIIDWKLRTIYISKPFIVLAGQFCK